MTAPAAVLVERELELVALERLLDSARQGGAAPLGRSHRQLLTNKSPA